MAPRTPLLFAVAGLAALTLGTTSGFLLGKLGEGSAPREIEIDATDKEHGVIAPPKNPSSHVVPLTETEEALYLEDLEEIPDPPRRSRVRVRVPVPAPAPPGDPTALDESPIPPDAGTNTDAAGLLSDGTLAPAPTADEEAEHPSWKEDDGLGTKSKLEANGRTITPTPPEEDTESADNEPIQEPHDEAPTEDSEKNPYEEMLRRDEPSP